MKPEYLITLVQILLNDGRLAWTVKVKKKSWFSVWKWIKHDDRGLNLLDVEITALPKVIFLTKQEAIRQAFALVEIEVKKLLLKPFNYTYYVETEKIQE